MKMFRVIVSLISHGLAMAGGFALGIYMLPNIQAANIGTDVGKRCGGETGEREQ
jgi:hypothetical protein